MLRLAPPVTRRAAVRQLPEVTPARGTRRGRVALLQGCVQRVFFGDVNAATVRVLAAEGFEVHAPRAAALLRLAADARRREEEARDAGARRRSRPSRTSSTSRSTPPAAARAMKDYAHLLPDDPDWAERAAAFSAKVRDVTELLAEFEPQARAPPVARCASPTTTPATSRTPSSVRAQPRALLRGIPGLELLEPADWEICCGSAGIYNLVEPRGGGRAGRAQGGQPASPPAPRPSPRPTPAARCRSTRTSATAGCPSTTR